MRQKSGTGKAPADFARANNVTQIVIGKSSRSWWFELVRGSVVHDFVRRAGNISVHVINWIPQHERRSAEDSSDR